MTTNPLVSVIVPVYNAAAYLSRCLESLMAQTHANIECIVIDDGSKDASGDLCDQWQARDPRIVVVHQENAGVSATRQRGLQCATGDYVIHADPDDWVEPHMIEHLVAKAEAEQADMVICDYLYVTRTKEEHISQRVGDTDHFRVLQKLFQGLHGSCCNKLVRRSAILQYGAIFPAGVYYCEDVYFNASLLVHPVKVAYLPEALYHYDAVINPSSLVKKYDTETYRHDQQLLALFKDLLDQPQWEQNVWPTARAGLSLLVVKRMFCRGRFTHKEFYERGQQYLDGCTGDYRWKIRLFLQLLRWKMYLPLKQLYALK